MTPASPVLEDSGGEVPPPGDLGTARRCPASGSAYITKVAHAGAEIYGASGKPCQRLDDVVTLLTDENEVRLRDEPVRGASVRVFSRAIPVPDEKRAVTEWSGTERRRHAGPGSIHACPVCPWRGSMHPVDGTSADWRNCDTCGGVADRRSTRERS